MTDTNGNGDAPVVHPTEIVKISDLRPHPGNYRRHPDDQRAHIRQSIREHGFYRNVVICHLTALPQVDNHGLALRQVREVRSPRLRKLLEPDAAA